MDDGAIGAGDFVELLRRARSGEADAWTGIYAACVSRVRGLAAMRLGHTLHDLVDCDDVVQQAMAIAFARLAQFGGGCEGSFVCWLAAIVESQVRDAARAAAAGKRGGGGVVRRADLGISTLAHVAPADRGPSPSRAAGAGELDARLERALLALGAPGRQIVYCRLVLDMDFAAIAAELALASADSARAMFHKAVAQLRTRLEGCGLGDSA